jgi:hypothetical protein
MPGRRPASYTTFAVLNFVYGGLLLLCAVCSGIDTPITVNNRDVTQELKTFLNQEIPNYSVYKIGGAVFGFFLAAGLIAAGVGLLYTQTWGRVLGLVCAILGILHHAGLVILQLVFVNPALNRFFAFGPINLGFLPQSVGLVGVIFEGLGIVYFLLEVILLAIQPARPVVDVREDDWDDRPRRRRRPRPASWEDDE